MAPPDDPIIEAGPIIIEGNAVEVPTPENARDEPIKPRDAGFTAVPPGIEGNGPVQKTEPEAATPPRPVHHPALGPALGDEWRESWRDGWWGIGALMVAAAFLGALFAALFQIMGAAGDASDAESRLSDMEVRIGQIAAGNPDAAAQSSFADLATHVDGLQVRVQAIEAALAALESGDSNGNEPVLPQVDGTTPPGGAMLAAKVDAAVRMLSELSTRLDELEQGGGNGSTGDDPAAITALRTVLDDATRRIAALELVTGPDLAQRLSEFATLSAQSVLESRLTMLERSNSAAASRRAAQSLALVQLIRATGSAGPFVRELELMMSIAGGGADFSVLSRASETGAATVDDLKQGFDDVAYAVIEAERSLAASDWLDQLWNNMVALISARATGDIAGDNAEARAARAELRLGEGRLPDAIAELDALPEGVRAAAAGWLERARKRADIDRMVGELADQLIASLARDNGDPFKDLGRP